MLIYPLFRCRLAPVTRRLTLFIYVQLCYNISVGKNGTATHEPTGCS